MPHSCPRCHADGHLIDSVRTSSEMLSHLFECEAGHVFSACAHPRSLRTSIADVKVAGVGITMRQERCGRCGAHVEFLRDGRVIERRGADALDVTEYFPEALPGSALQVIDEHRGGSLADDDIATSRAGVVS